MYVDTHCIVWGRPPGRRRGSSWHRPQRTRWQKHPTTNCHSPTQRTEQLKPKRSISLHNECWKLF